MTSESFGKWRHVFWPIHKQEISKFLPMCLIMFCILFNYTILRNLKDALVNTAAGSGAQSFSSLKLYVVMPSAVAFVVLYTKLANIFSRDKLFIGIISTFLIFFGLFAFVMYPNVDALHPSIDVVNTLKAQFPVFKAIIPVWGVWTYSLFYLMAELWGSVMISLLFWQFANDVVKTEEAKRFYAMFGLFANFALILSGYIGNTVLDIKNVAPGADAWGNSLKLIALTVMFMGVVAIVSYLYLNQKILKDPSFVPDKSLKKKKKSKPKLSVSESFKYIFTNPYIGLIAILVIGYGISINLIEVVWKHNIKIVHPDPRDYNIYMNNFSMMTGFATILMILFTKGIVTRFGWFAAAIITPSITIITGAIFFTLIFTGDALTGVATFIGQSIPWIAIQVGAAQNFLTKATKYSNFDPTKEMAYIPLDPELKSKGKAAVDVIGGRLGKAGGALIQQVLFIGFKTDNVMMIAPYLAVIVSFVVGAWAYAVRSLSKRYEALIDETHV